MKTAKNDYLPPICADVPTTRRQAGKIGWLRTLKADLLRHEEASGFEVLVLRFPSNIRELLTDRQLQVADFLADGLLDKEIAAALEIHLSTVRAHLREAEKRLGARNRVHLAVFIAMLRLLETPSRRTGKKKRRR